MAEAASFGGIGAVVFDLDGTLVDSRPDLARAVETVRAGLGLPPVGVAVVEGWIGEGARRLVEKALADAPRPVDVDAALAAFLAAYEPICTERTFPYAGIPGLLAGLAARLPLALLTNKPERMTRKIVRHCGWEALFRPLVGGDTLPFRKPDPRGLEEIARELGLPAAELLLVGDSAIDRATAHAAGSRFLWAEWGFAGAGERAGLAGETRAADPAAAASILAAAR